MAATFKALSALLSYPSAELQAAVPEIRSVLVADALLEPKRLLELEPLLAGLTGGDLYTLQEDYVDLFDKSRQRSLHLFEHVHGESRDRGQAMVDLAALYEAGGLVLAANELPDYLPLFLEYLSTRPLEEARGLLRDTGHILTSLAERLLSRDVAYAGIFTALLAIAGQALADGKPPAATNEGDDLAALDAAWEETAVTFGPGDAFGGGCSADRTMTRIRAGKRDARAQTR
jgi:nitrate reductase delta subunit